MGVAFCAWVGSGWYATIKAGLLNLDKELVEIRKEIHNSEQLAEQSHTARYHLWCEKTEQLNRKQKPP